MDLCVHVAGGGSSLGKIKDFSIFCDWANFQAVEKLTTIALGFHPGPSQPERMLERLSLSSSLQSPREGF